MDPRTPLPTPLIVKLLTIGLYLALSGNLIKKFLFKKV